MPPRRGGDLRARGTASAWTAGGQIAAYRLPGIFRASRLAEEADGNLFKTIAQCPSHVLRHLLTDKPTSSRSLRVRAHNFVLPPKDNRNFLSRALYNAICPPMGDA